MGLVERAPDRAIRRRPHLRFLTARGGEHAAARDGKASEPAETPPAPRPAPAALSRPDRRRLEGFCAGRNRHCVCYCVDKSRQSSMASGKSVIYRLAPALRRLPGPAAESKFSETVATPYGTIKPWADGALGRSH